MLFACFCSMHEQFSIISHKMEIASEARRNVDELFGQFILYISTPNQSTWWKIWLFFLAPESILDSITFLEKRQPEMAIGKNKAYFVLYIAPETRSLYPLIAWIQRSTTYLRIFDYGLACMEIRIRNTRYIIWISNYWLFINTNHTSEVFRLDKSINESSISHDKVC